MTHHQRIDDARREAIEWIRSGRPDLAEAAIGEAERELFEAERETKTTKTQRHEENQLSAFVA